MNYRNYEIYQLNIHKRISYNFAGWDFAKAHGFNFNDYDKIYEGKTRGSDLYNILEDFFDMFNLNRPKDFTGHSLSVSDIVVLTDESDNKTAYYCDLFGWKPIDVLKEARQ